MLFANRVFAGAPSTVFRMSYYSEQLPFGICLTRRGPLRARSGDIRSHVGAHLSIPKKWSKVRADGGIQSEVRSCGQCSKGRGEWSCCEGSSGLSDPTLENRQPRPCT